MRLVNLLLLGITFTGYSACKSTNNMDNTTDETMAKELSVIDSLLRDEKFAYRMAAALDSAYYVGVGEKPREFISRQDDSSVFSISEKDELIATNLAGFYALECGIELISSVTGQTFCSVLEKMLAGKTDSGGVLILNRFANATWKAGQPFKGLSRIKRQTFTPFYFLSKEDIDKDLVQVKAAAKMLLQYL